MAKDPQAHGSFPSGGTDMTVFYAFTHHIDHTEGVVDGQRL
jgi:hypothetical protein